MKSFLRVWIGTLVTLALLVVGLNVLVDPYDIFGTPRLARVSLIKAGAKNHSMLAKTYQIARAQPATVLFGSSSTDIGVDAADPAWPQTMQPIYDYGIPGGSATNANLRTFQEAVALGGVKNAVELLDFQNFLSPDPDSATLSEDDRRFHLLATGEPNPYRTGQIARDMFLSLATVGALIDSCTTILRQGNLSSLNIAANGSTTESDFMSAARNDGMHDLFAQKIAFERGRATDLAHSMADWRAPLPNLSVISAIIKLARENGIKLTFVIVPHHADAMELYWRLGLWPRVEQFKREVADLVAVEGKDVSLWDFMDYSRFNTGSVPKVGDRHTPTDWFWEPSHFKKQLGHVMIERVAGASTPDFGAILTRDTVEARNLTIRAQRRSVVCGGNRPFLSELENPPDDGCLKEERIARQPD